MIFPMILATMWAVVPWTVPWAVILTVMFIRTSRHYLSELKMSAVLHLVNWPRRCARLLRAYKPDRSGGDIVSYKKIRVFK